ncbi:glycosyltransferase family 1 protein [Oxalobacteraceae bacterium OM1]|nr:glycosyltransferase family 1 protein [Oxalobacteraceae bacterium OM1]
MRSLIVFSHLGWDFVYQRPQHLLSRLSKHYRILFIEEPRHGTGEPHFARAQPLANLTVLTPVTPAAQPHFSDEQMPYLRQLVRQLRKEAPDPIVWFYTPMALPLLEELEPQHVVYDCMDELSAFKNAPPQLLEREQALFNVADIVFTGGPSIYAAKKDRHPNVHCFPSSVDVAHFRQALDRNNQHPSQAGIPRPRLGFYGVIDERLDVDLVAAMADAHPEWQLVLVGPVHSKIDPAILPQRPNIHYVGQQPYSALPRFLAAWDVCLMPFALNESTRFISPTKSLEYMAAELPIASTPVKDVVDLHADVVAIAEGPEAFIAACEAALALSSEDMRRKVMQMREKLSRTSWDSTASQMRDLLDQLDGESTRVDATPAQRVAGSRT